jgi:hypothetical protein
VNSLNFVQFQSAGVSDRRLKGEGFWGGEGEQCSRVGEGERQQREWPLGCCQLLPVCRSLGPAKSGRLTTWTIAC